MSRTFFLILLTALITIINYFDRTAFSYTILPIQQDLQLNNQQFGAAAGMFGVGYLLMTLFAGPIVDRFGSIRVWGISAIFWSLITIALGRATDYWSLSGLLFILGIAEGFNSPALLKTITDWLSPKWRARGLSLSLLGVPLASMIGAPFITSLIETLNWRWMFAALGGLGIGWAFLWFWFFKNHPIPPFHTSHREKIPWKLLLTNRCYLSNAFSFFTFGSIVFFSIIWLPGYLEQTFHIPLRSTGFLVILPWLISAILQTLGGWLIDVLYKKTHSIRISRIYITSFGLLMASLLFFLLAFSHHLSISIALVSLGLGFTFFINPAIYSLNADLFPKHIGTAQSLSTCCFAIAGIISPSLTGWITQMTSSYEAAILFIATLPLVASAISFFFCKPDLGDDTSRR